MSDHIASERSSISVINRDERSLLTTAVQLVVRSFRSQLSSRDAAKHEDGSVRIDTLKAKLPGCTLSERIVCDIYIYDIVSRKNPAKDPKKRIYYFAGGSWQTPPSGQHYRICAKMARDMPDAIVSIVSTPLAPNNPAPGTFPICMKLYRALMAQAEEAGERVILAGDSSGANMILCMTLEALKEDNDHEQADTRQMPHPTAIMAVCPSTDLTRDNPDIQKIAPKDPLLTPDIINHTAKAWHDKWDPADRRVSPINNDISLLSKRGIKVHGITAGCDILSPDGVLFRDRCAKFGVEGEWVHWEKQMHCFILTMQYGLREAEEAVQWMIDILKKE
ncbi:Nn.00g081570.m01.CDS01 [Neocucurbitaria sp. VM-36]